MLQLPQPPQVRLPASRGASVIASAPCRSLCPSVGGSLTVSAGSVPQSVPVTLAGRHAIQPSVSVLSSREQTPSVIVRQVSLQSQQRPEPTPGSLVVRSVSQQPHQPQQQQPALIHSNPLLQQDRGHGSIVRQFSLPRVLRPPSQNPLLTGHGASADVAVRTPGMHSPKEVRRPPRATETVQVTVQPPMATTMAAATVSAAAATYVPFAVDTPKTGASVATSIAELAQYSSDHGSSLRDVLSCRQQEQADVRSSGASSSGGGEAGSTPRRSHWEQELPSAGVTPPGGGHAAPEAYIISGPESLLVRQNSAEQQPVVASADPSNQKLEAVRQQAEKLMRLSEADAPISEGVKLQECEDRLATCARLRRKQRNEYENAQRTRQEKEEAVENAKRVLRALEEQERKVRAEGSCIAGCSSTSLRQHWEARNRMLLDKRRHAEATVKMAQQQLECQAQTEKQMKEQLRKGGQRAMAAMEAVSRQRACMLSTPPQSPTCSQRQSSVVRNPSSASDLDRSQRTVGLAKGKQPSVLTSASPLARVSRGPRCRPGGLPPSIADVQKPVTRSQSPSTLRRTLRQKAEATGLASSASSDSLLPAGRSERCADFSGEAGNDGELAQRAMEALQTAQLLQEKLAAMPEHLRQGITKQCAERCGLTEATAPSATMSASASAAAL